MACIHKDVKIEWLTQEKYKATCLDCGLIYEGPTGRWKQQLKFGSANAKLVYDRPPRWASNAVKYIELRDNEFKKAVGEFQRRMMIHVENKKKCIPLFELSGDLFQDPEVAATTLLEVFLSAERNGWDLARIIADRVKGKKNAEPFTIFDDGRTVEEDLRGVRFEPPMPANAAGEVLANGEQQ